MATFPPCRAPCAERDCPHPPQKHDHLCWEHRRELDGELAYLEAKRAARKDDYWMQRIDEARGK